jgi:hypothetical protein
MPDILEEAKVFPIPNQETRILISRMVAEIERLRAALASRPIEKFRGYE